MATNNDDQREPRPKNRTAQRFIDALATLEERGDHEEIVALFGDGCQVSNVQLEKPMEGSGGAERYWRQYRHTFKDVKSRFTRITEQDGSAVLEWITEGTLETGRPIQYRGVSVLQLDGDRISDFMAYFDSRPFTEHL
jgi:steroid delta-isomerase-like uncharacterized protein